MEETMANSGSEQAVKAARCLSERGYFFLPAFTVRRTSRNFDRLRTDQPVALMKNVGDHSL